MRTHLLSYPLRAAGLLLENFFQNERLVPNKQLEGQIKEKKTDSHATEQVD